MNNSIIITWKAFSNNPLLNNPPATSACVEVDYDLKEITDIELCNAVFSQTNTYRGRLWNKLEPLLPDNRSHTALSVGDEVTIITDNLSRTYRCDDFGWAKISNGVVLDTQSSDVVQSELAYTNALPYPFPSEENK